MIAPTARATEEATHPDNAQHQRILRAVASCYAADRALLRQIRERQAELDRKQS